MFKGVFNSEGGIAHEALKPYLNISSKKKIFDGETQNSSDKQILVELEIFYQNNMFMSFS